MASFNDLPIIWLGHLTTDQEKTMSPKVPRVGLRIPLATSITTFLCVGLMAHAGAFAATKAAAKEGGKKRATKVTFIDSSSSESPEARVKRLKIECKGRPNAGMCLGHTR